ncbi:molybdate transport system substrate-binding protein [Sinobacterium caligoides]|uniref:Molybdate transport system substrate-binding protein n=1 Tax=Sinobacterium caligoides TaxID=933926 RepID=A0A3N2DQ65_9GAMM|nr:molybdate ABC transporter substrate-binding protein [Sinobacterium caligoides]ROS01937.1 molybdate transport system substrate-binding protein [Sinobacterium caligoides]
MRPFLAAIIISLSLSSTLASAEQITVAVAANFKPALASLLPAFEQETGHQVKLSSASTGILYAQITKGAPFAIFFAADSKRPLRLEQQQLIRPGSRATYAFGQIAVISQQPQMSQAQLIEQMRSATLAIANAQTAPYGVAAEQLLHCWGLDARLSDAVRANNIAQVLHYAASKTVDVAVISQSQWPQLQASGKDNGWYHYDVPHSCYQPIEQQMAVLDSQSAAAQALHDYLLRPSTQQQLRHWGYRAASN